ncbi:MAG: copper-binding protein [Rhodocyclaceae bacterium]|nr:MAG: copper-binding protein [Rhodocyclaceae bacterium]
MKREYLALLWAAGTLLLAGSSLAQENHDHNHGAAAAGEAKNDGEQTSWTTGEVRKVDLGQKRITLRHGAITNLGMDPMTMVFRVRDAKLLEGLQVGSKIRFRAEQAADILYLTEVQALQ